jgi:mono/diheme cytochrome c family protein
MPRSVRLVALAHCICLLACSSSSSNAGTTTTGDAVAGKADATKYACASCHGTDLSGLGTAYPGTTAYAANLTPDKETGIGDWDADTIKTAILTGKDDEGKALCAPMPTFGDRSMTASEAADIAAYLQTLPAVSKAIPGSVCAASAGAAGSASK